MSFIFSRIDNSTFLPYINLDYVRKVLYWCTMMNKKYESIRSPAVAGQFYDADPSSLDRCLNDLFANCADINPLPDTTKVRAIVSPHAGYLYSGRTAARVFHLLKRDFDYNRAVVIAPSHRISFLGLAASTYTAYRTPLGDIQIDKDASEKLALSPAVSILNAAHGPEHALEVQLPFLQKIIKDAHLSEEFKILPLICGGLDDESARAAAEALIPYWNPETLWIISSDFTHYGDAFGYLPFTEDVPENLKKLDFGAIDRILDLDFKGFSDYLDRTGATICGANPLKLLLKSIELSIPDDKVTARLIDYTNSGELTGDYSHCVSYAGVAFFA